MSYCPKCGSKVEEEMSFCPKCGAPLRAEKVAAPPPAAPTTTYRRDEKSEKGEKSEKSEKGEKHEHGFMGPLIGGVVLLFIGWALYLQATGYNTNVVWALFFVLIGLLVIAGGVYGVLVAGRRHPRT